MPRVGLELTIPVFEGTKTFYALDRVPTVTDSIGRSQINSVVKIYLIVRKSDGKTDSRNRVQTVISRKVQLTEYETICLQVYIPTY